MEVDGWFVAEGGTGAGDVGQRVRDVSGAGRCVFDGAGVSGQFAQAADGVVERLCARHPKVAARVVLSGEPHWPNAKVWSLDKMISASTNAFLVISDSDVLVRSDFLRNVIPPLLHPHSAAGLVTCLYAGGRD